MIMSIWSFKPKLYPDEQLSSINNFDDELVVKIIPIQNSEGAFASLSTSKKSTKLIVALSYPEISIDFDKKDRKICCEGEWMSTTTNTHGGAIKLIISISCFGLVSLVGISSLAGQIRLIGLVGISGIGLVSIIGLGNLSIINIIGQTSLIGPSALLACQLISLIGFVGLVGLISISLGGHNGVISLVGHVCQRHLHPRPCRLYWLWPHF
jgi:hypothetical protein